MLKKSRLLIVAAIATAAFGASAVPASAQNRQEGLVNVAVEDVTVQIPISVAANVCDVNVAVLAQMTDQARMCTATADSAASAGPSQGGPTRQEGLVNVLLDDVIVQVPVALAANICDVNVAVLADVADDAAVCRATSESIAATPQGGGGGNGGNSANAQAFSPIDLDLEVLGGTPLSFLDNDTTTNTGIPFVSQ
jgi:hypothetical protein